MLHIINKSQFIALDTLPSLAYLGKGDHVLLIEDGVYAAIETTASCKLLHEKLAIIHVYALLPDVQARGILNKISNKITLIDYEQFVELTIKCPTSTTWL